MKVDIKSFLIGVLTTVNLFLLMGFEDHKEENLNGRYQVIYDPDGETQYWYDTRYGDKVATNGSFGFILLKEEGGIQKMFDKEFQLVEALKERD